MRATALGIAARSVLAPLVLAGRYYRVGREVPADEDVPEARSSFWLAAKIALDEVFFTTEFVSSALVTPAHRHRIAAEVSRAVRLYKSRGWLEHPEEYHRTPPPLVDVDLKPAESGGLHFEHLTFESGYSPDPEEPGYERWRSYAPNHTAHAWVLRHPGSPGPWLICLPGYRMGTPLTDFAGFAVRWLHHRLGLNLVIPVFPFHGPRTVGRRGGDGFLTGDFIDTVHMEAQGIWDARRLIGWVRGTQEATRVGAYGLSLGGLTVALLASLEPELHCVIAGIPAVCVLRLTEAHAPAALRRLAEYGGLDWGEIGRALRVIGPLHMTPRVPRERLFLFGGIADRLVLPDHVRDLWRHWGRPRIQWYDGGHVSFLWDEQVRSLVRDALTGSGLSPALV